ncbi:MAG: N-6 DNA methylase, partial [Ignavibacteriaceae bacterium]
FFEKGKPTSKIWYWEHKLPEGQKSYSKTKTIRVEEFNELKNWWMKRIENEQAWKVDIKTIEENGYNLDIKNPFRQEEKQEYSSAELLEMLHMSFEKSNQLLDQLKMVMK